MDQPWRIELFGWLRVVQANRVVSRFRTRRAAALLAYLSYFRHRSHHREQLIERFWPGCAPTAGRTNLRSELTSLRHQLEPPGIPPGAVLLTTRDTVRLNPEACVTDVALFEAALLAAERADSPAGRMEPLMAAAELYRGELLPGSFEEWVLPERQRLAEAHLQALHALVTLAEETGDGPRAVQWARRAVAADPLDEESHHLLIRLLIAAGQIEAARAQYEQGEHLLLQNLSTGLSPEIHALVRDLAPSKDWSPPAPPGKPRKPRRVSTPSPVPEMPAPGPAASPELAVGGCPTDNLPLRFTRFFGREREIERLCELLGLGVGGWGLGVESGPAPPDTQCPTPNARLLTLTGPGGTGKTRLALQAAQRLREAFRGGVWFVSLLDLTDPALIPDQMLLSLRQPRDPHREALEQVVKFLSHAPSLLLLDNFEHLVGEGAAVVQHLLEQVQHLTALVTSRQRLGLEGEREFPVGPLPVPGVQVFRCSGVQEGVTPSLEYRNTRTPEHLNTLSRFPSVALFLDRAQAARPDFQVTAGNAGAIADLCRQLEGLPLAIELAAARAWVLTPQQMLTRLEQRFELLASRQRSADPRHRSLRATLDWSYQLLSPELQRFFARLSIFRGGWTASAAEATCGEPKALQYLEELRECSMVQATETAGEIRFHLLETLREYGAERLAEVDRAPLARQHALFYLALGETAEPELKRADQELWLDRLEVEHDNLRAALVWSMEGGAGSPAPSRREKNASSESLDPTELGLRLGGALVEFWSARGYRKEGHDRLVRLLSQPGAASGTAVHAKALAGAGRFSGLEAARSLCEEALAIWRRLGDRAGIAGTLQHLGSLHYPGDLPAARAAQEESLAIRRELGDPRAIALSLRGMGWVALAQGQVPTARACLEESTAIFRELDDRRGLIGSLDSLGYMAFRHGDADTARSLFEEELAAATELDVKEHIAYARTHLAEVACMHEDYATALPLFEQARAIWREIDDSAGLINTLHVLGWAVRCQGNHAAAHELVTEALAVSRRWGSNRSVAWSTWLLGEVAGDLGDWEEAAAHFTECLTLFGQGQQSDGLVIPRCLHGLARLACVQGEPARAARLLGTAEALDAASGVGLWPAQRREFEQSVSVARARLAEAEFAAAWAEGQAMPLDQALALARREVSGS